MQVWISLSAKEEKKARSFGMQEEEGEMSGGQKVISGVYLWSFSSAISS